MALNAYLRMKAVKSGDIKGSCTEKGRKGRILVYAAAHEILSPRDPASGLPTGKRQHRPFAIVKEIDSASPVLYQLLTTNELITEWELQFWGPSLKAGAGAGSAVQRYTVTLTNAAISDIRFTMPNNRDRDLAKCPEYEEVSFTYHNIAWTWTDGGITSMDDWMDDGA